MINLTFILLLLKGNQFWGRIGENCRTPTFIHCNGI